MEIKAPNDYRHAARPWVFTAGSIEMGAAEDWQARLVSMVAGITWLNPRRDDWDSSWEQSIDNPQFREQVEWELKALDDCDLVVLYLSPGTKSPITLLELGLFHRKAVVCCPDGYWRKGNVDIVCARYGVPQVGSLEELARRAAEVKS